MKAKLKMILPVLLFAALTVNAQQEPPRPPAPPSPEARLKDVSSKLQKELTLNAVQKQKVEAAYKAFFSNMEKLRGNNPPPPPPPPGKKEDVEKLEKQRDELVKKALSEAQFKKYQQIEPSLRPRRPQGPPPPPQAPTKKR